MTTYRTNGNARERILVRVYGIAVRVSQSGVKKYRPTNATADDFANEFIVRLLEGRRGKELTGIADDEMNAIIIRGVRQARRRSTRHRASRPVVTFTDCSPVYDFDPPCPNSTNAELERAQRIQQVRDALAKLDPTDAAILMARFADGMTLREAEKRFSLNRATIVRRSLAAMAAIRQVLAEKGVEQPRRHDELVTLADAVKMMQVGPRNIQKWVRRGRLERFSTGKTGYYSRRQLESIKVDRRMQRSTRFLTNGHANGKAMANGVAH